MWRLVTLFDCWAHIYVVTSIWNEMRSYDIPILEMTKIYYRKQWLLAVLFFSFLFAQCFITMWWQQYRRMIWCNNIMINVIISIPEIWGYRLEYHILAPIQIGELPSTLTDSLEWYLGLSNSIIRPPSYTWLHSLCASLHSAARYLTTHLSIQPIISRGHLSEGGAAEHEQIRNINYDPSLQDNPSLIPDFLQSKQYMDMFASEHQRALDINLWYVSIISKGRDTLFHWRVQHLSSSVNITCEL